MVTDNTGVVHLKKAKQTSMLLRWILTIQIFDLEIVHRPGRLSGNVDTLSRQAVRGSNQDLEFLYLELNAMELEESFARRLWREQQDEFGPKEGLHRDGLGRIKIPKSLAEEIDNFYPQYVSLGD